MAFALRSIRRGNRFVQSGEKLGVILIAFMRDSAFFFYEGSPGAQGEPTKFLGGQFIEFCFNLRQAHGQKFYTTSWARKRKS